jgi:hypothetical protein
MLTYKSSVYESSSDDEVEDATFHVEHRHGKGLAQQDSDDEEEQVGDVGGNEEEEEEEGDDSKEEEDHPFPTIQKPVKPATRRCFDYKFSGMKKEVKRLRRIDPYIEEKTSTGFYNQFQQDFYELVILSDRKIAVEAQWVDWDYMERADDSLFKEIISECEDKKIKTLMGFKKNWNKVLIAQFYATVYFGSLDGDRAMLWMTEGNFYRVTFNQFVRVLNFDRYDVNWPKIHN